MVFLLHILMGIAFANASEDVFFDPKLPGMFQQLIESLVDKKPYHCDPEAFDREPVRYDDKDTLTVRESLQEACHVADPVGLVKQVLKQAASQLPRSAKANEVLNGLSTLEIAAIYSYTYQCYNALNFELRRSVNGSTPLLKRHAELIATLTKGVSRLPAYEGTVHRIACLPDSALAEHAVGNTVVYPAYTSASYDPKWSTSGTGTWKDRAKVCHGFTIHSHQGHKIDLFAASPEEKEVLFLPGTRFRVVGRTQRPGDVANVPVYDFELEEVR